MIVFKTTKYARKKNTVYYKFTSEYKVKVSKHSLSSRYLKVSNNSIYKMASHHC